MGFAPSGSKAGRQGGLETKLWAKDHDNGSPLPAGLVVSGVIHTGGVWAFSFVPSSVTEGVGVKPGHVHGFGSGSVVEVLAVPGTPLTFQAIRPRPCSSFVLEYQHEFPERAREIRARFTDFDLKSLQTQTAP